MSCSFPVREPPSMSCSIGARAPGNLTLIMLIYSEMWIRQRSNVVARNILARNDG